MKLRHLPLFALRAFIVTAQTGSVVKAAEELSVTHGAVSRQLAILEEWLGQPVFVRDGRRLRLTVAGTRLAAEAGESLADIMVVCQDLRGVPRRRQISIVSPATFTMNWLMPKIKTYETIDREVDIWLRTRMANEQPEFSSADLVVTRGSGFDQQVVPRNEVILFDEILTVLASPVFLHSQGISEPRDILANSRIAALTRPADWANWLEMAGLNDESASVRHRFDHQFVAIHAARAGIGSIVAPVNLLQPDGDLAAPFPELSVRGLPYVLHHRTSEPDYIRRFVIWLADQAPQTMTTPN